MGHFQGHDEIWADRRFTSTAKAVWCLIEEQARMGPVTVRAMADRLGCCRDSISRGIAALEAAGAIVLTRIGHCRVTYSLGVVPETRTSPVLKTRTLRLRREIKKEVVASAAGQMAGEKSGDLAALGIGEPVRGELASNPNVTPAMIKGASNLPPWKAILRLRDQSDQIIAKGRGHARKATIPIPLACDAPAYYRDHLNGTQKQADEAAFALIDEDHRYTINAVDPMADLTFYRAFTECWRSEIATVWQNR